jgi:general secretion pathway protein G
MIKKRYLKSNLGFTLIEIVVVIAIMAVLTVVIYASFSGAKAQSRDQERITNISSIQLALETYYNQKHKYPENLSLLTPLYINKIPTPPSGSPSGSDYSYNYVPIGVTLGICSSYHLWTKLETNNINLSSKKGFSSITSSTACAGVATYPTKDASVSSNSLIYDVTQ